MRAARVPVVPSSMARIARSGVDWVAVMSDRLQLFCFGLTGENRGVGFFVGVDGCAGRLPLVDGADDEAGQRDGRDDEECRAEAERGLDHWEEEQADGAADAADSTDEAVGGGAQFAAVGQR